MPNEFELSSELSPQRVFDLIPASRSSGIRVEELEQALSLGPSDRPQLERYLSEFVRCGLATTARKRYWRLRTRDVLIGAFTGSMAGHAFVVPDDPKERGRGDLFIGRRWTGPALHGDRVI